MSNIDNIYFDVTTLKADFNKRVNVNDLYSQIQKKYSLNEITKYALVCYYKWKKNLVFISFTNEKVFVTSNKYNLPVNGVYSYQDIFGFSFIEGKKINSFLFKTSNGDYLLKNITKNVYNEFLDVFEREKTIFINSKIGQNIMQSASNFNSLDSIKLDENKKDEYENFVDFSKHNYSDLTYSTSSLQEKNNEILNSNSKKNKRVVNDEDASANTTFSSSYISSLLTNKKELLPNKSPTLLKSIDDRLLEIEKNNIFDKPLDSIALKFTTNSKLNTIPVLAEFSSLTNSDKVENRLLFSRNWIEFTKHNVKNKILGVDENGNGTYIDIKNANSDKIIKSYKAKDYIINGSVRYGLRSSLTCSLKEQTDQISLESMYYSPATNEKLDVWKYDGIIFMNKKYYFNIPSEFDVLQRKWCKIHHFEKESANRVMVYELIFEDNKVRYNVYSDQMKLLDDNTNVSALYDLKWLTFFKD
ncbi:PH domain-containing protein [Malacoplasma muris]|uniref:PH domain-containing protein n=1 Tax=Malacoplasma muris TaxID=2119 RepID=UPI00398E5930